MAKSNSADQGRDDEPPVLTQPAHEDVHAFERRTSVVAQPEPFGVRLSPVARQALTDALCAAISRHLDERLEQMLDQALEKSLDTARDVLRDGIHEELNTLLPELIRDALKAQPDESGDAE